MKLILINNRVIHELTEMYHYFQGFYTVYKDVFENLAQEDYVFMPDMTEDDEFPTFGNSQSDYEEVC